MTKRPKSRHTKNFARRMLRRLSSGNGILAKINEHDRVEFFYVYQRFAALKWLQRGHQIFYTTPKGKGEGVLILYFFRKDVIIPTKYLDYKTLWLTVRGPRHAKKFLLMKSVVCSCGAKELFVSMVAECGDCKHVECEHADSIIESCNGAECCSDCKHFEPFCGIAQESCGHGCMLLTCATCKKETAIVYGE